jgi:hypothetical protein
LLNEHCVLNSRRRLHPQWWANGEALSAASLSICMHKLMLNLTIGSRSPSFSRRLFTGSIYLVLLISYVFQNRLQCSRWREMVRRPMTQSQQMDFFVLPSVLFSQTIMYIKLYNKYYS